MSQFKEPQQVSAFYALLEIIGQEFEMYDKTSRCYSDPSDICYPTIGMLDSCEDYYLELRKARKYLGLPIDIRHEDFVEPDFKAKLKKDVRGTIQASRIWPMLVEECGLLDAKEILDFIETETENDEDWDSE